MNKTLLMYLILVVVLSIGAVFFFMANRASTDESAVKSDKIELSQRSLLEILEQAEKFTKEGQIDQAKGSLDAFSESLNEFFVLLSDKDDIEQIITKGGGEIERIRKAEWSLYDAFYEKKDVFDLNKELVVQTKVIEDQIFVKLENSIISATEVMRFEYWKKGNQQDQQGRLFVPTVFAQEPLSSKVIYTAKRIDLNDPGSQGKLIQDCWRYESWAELSTENLREQNQVNFGGGVRERTCEVEIDIASGASDKKLALDPVRKKAEWMDFQKGKIGISGREATNNFDPFQNFNQQLKSGEYELQGTEVIDGQEVYALRRDYSKLYNYDTLDFDLLYINATTYLPIRRTSYGEIIEIKRTEIQPIYNEDDFFPAGAPPTPTIKTEIIRTGVIEKVMNVIIEGKFIERSELPQDFFEMKIPDGYRLEDFVGFG